MTIKEFLKKFNSIADECTTNGEVASSHPGISSNVIICDSDFSYYDIVNFDVNRLPGCGCWTDVVIEIKKIDK